MMAGTFELRRSSNGQFYFSLKASNGEPILASELYQSKAGAEHGLQSVKTNAPLESRYERKTASSGQPYFVLKAANGEPIGRSETYASTAAMEHGIAAVKRDASTATVEDLT
jgi:uncharacterized protein YegP (UPF0339 family)